MIGTRLLDRYELVGELGKGGMAIVYRAKDPRLGREVAVKMIATDGLGEAAVERFQREAQVVAALDHPAIAPIYDFGRHESWLFFVMPVLHGRTLHQLLRDRRLPLDETLEIIAQVAEALDYSASNDVVHRDIKPENIMVSLDRGKVARVWVMDFGLALPRTSSRLTKTGNLPGTLSYLSPEQILSAELDGRSDLYSLGTILYECLSGQAPFAGSPATVLYRIVHEKPVGLESQGVDPRLESLVMSCMAKYPEERMARGQDLADALRGYMHDLRQGEADGRRLPRIGRRVERPGDTPLVGRLAETSELRARLEMSIAGECQLVLISGERGMGKSRLLRELENEAQSRRIQVLHGRFSSREGGYSYEAFGELIHDYFRRMHSGSSTGSHVALPKIPDFSDLASELLALFPALGEIPELCGAALEDRADQRRLEDPNHLYELIARTLTRMSGGEPLVLSLEQLHAADASIRLIQYLYQRLGPTPTLIVGTYRPSATGKRHPLNTLVRGVDGGTGALRLDLRALTRDAHRELLEYLIPGPSLTDELAERLFDASEGNPFFVQELVRTLTDSGELSAETLAERWQMVQESRLSGELPETIQQAVETRLERLDDGLLKILGAASVLGRRFDFRDLEELWDGREDLEDGIDGLISRDLLEEDKRTRGDWLRFSSALVREVVYSRLPRRRRRRLHRRHAESLEGKYQGRAERVLSQLVHHFSEGDVVDKTIEYGRMSARQSLDAYCWDDAVRAAEVALDFAEDEADASVEGDLRLILAEAQNARGRADAAVKEAGRAVRAFERAGDLDQASKATLLLAETAWKSRRLGDMKRWLDEGLQLAREGGSKESLSSLLTLAATSANLRGSYSEANQYLQEARSLTDDDPGDIEPAMPEAGAELRIGMLSELSTTDPVTVASGQDMEILSQVFEPLLQIDGDGNYVPRLCRALAVSEDGRTYTFQLRRELRFSDGTLLTAEHVKQSLEEALGQGPRRVQGILALLVGGREFIDGKAAEVSGLRVVRELELEMELGEPLRIFPALLSSQSLAITLRRQDVCLGTGPFRLGRNDRAWSLESSSESRIADKVLPRRLELLSFESSRHLADALRAGEVDIARGLAPVDLEDFFQSGRFRHCIRETTLPSIAFAFFNMHGPRCHRRGLRRILTGVIDGRELVWRRMARFALPAAGWIPPGLPGHDAEPQRPRPVDRYDAIGSMQDLTPLPIQLKVAMHPVFADQYRQITEAIFSEWSLLGIEIEVEKIGGRLGDRDWSAYDVVFSRWLPDYFDPDAYCYGIFHSRFGELGSMVGLEEVDRLLEQARRETRMTVRERLYRRIQRLLMHEHLMIPLFHEVDFRVHSPQVEGLVIKSQPPFVDYRSVGLLPEGAVRRSRPGAHRSGRLHIPLPGRFDELDPAQSIVSDCAEVASAVFETLARIDEGAGIVPHLAESIHSSDDCREFRIRLREVRFHDGRRLMPRDVRYSIGRLLRSGRVSLESTLLYIEGALAFHVGQSDDLHGIEILSDRELLIRLEKSVSYFPAMLSDPSTAIVPEGTVRFDGTWRDGCVGTGPFCLVGLEPGKRVELAANPDYWRPELPRCERLVFELGVSPSRVPKDFEAGRFQVVGHMSPPDLERFSGLPTYAANLREHPAFVTFFLAFNRLQGPLADPAVRTALDRRIRLTAALSQAKLGRIGVPAAGFIPPGLLIPEPVPPPSDSIGGERFDGLRLEIALHPLFIDQFSGFWKALTDDLARSGAELVVRHTSRSEMIEAASRRTVDVVATRWIADAPDPSSFADIFHSDEGFLGRMFCHERLDRLIERGRLERDLATRQEIYRELERIVGQEALVVPLFHEQVCWLAQPDVEGLRLRYGWPEIAYEELWLKR